MQDTFVGTDVFGVVRRGNQKGGVLIGGSANHNLIGVANTNPSNIISGNAGIGVTLGSGTNRNLVISNFIGLDKAGHPLPNRGLPIVDSGVLNLIFDNSVFP